MSTETPVRIFNPDMVPAVLRDLATKLEVTSGEQAAVIADATFVIRCLDLELHFAKERIARLTAESKIP